jgi:polyhydroxybutyrate depolymerase
MPAGRWWALAVIVALTPACSSGGSSTTPSEPPSTSAPAPATTAVLDVEGRPARVAAPAKLTAPAPVVVMLHGFTASAEEMDTWLGFAAAATAAGFVAIMPEGTKNSQGERFWNADPAWCCNQEHATVDDVGYIASLVDAAAARWPIDRRRVSAVGHSNGGFMAHALACQRSDRFAAVVSIAGSLPLSAGDCHPARPVSVLQVHGTADIAIAFDGDPAHYPGAVEVAQRWAALDGCRPAGVPGGRLDLDSGLGGAETAVTKYAGCDAASTVELWTIEGGTHVPNFGAQFMPAVLAWLEAHPGPG